MMEVGEVKAPGYEVGGGMDDSERGGCCVDCERGGILYEYERDRCTEAGR